MVGAAGYEETLPGDIGLPLIFNVPLCFHYSFIFYLSFRWYWLASSSLLSPPSDSSISGLCNVDNCPTRLSSIFQHVQVRCDVDGAIFSYPCLFRRFGAWIYIPHEWQRCLQRLKGWVGEVPIHGSADFKLKDLAVTWLCLHPFLCRLDFLFVSLLLIFW